MEIPEEYKDSAIIAEYPKARVLANKISRLAAERRAQIKDLEAQILDLTMRRDRLQGPINADDLGVTHTPSLVESLFIDMYYPTDYVDDSLEENIDTLFKRSPAMLVRYLGGTLLQNLGAVGGNVPEYVAIRAKYTSADGFEVAKLVLEGFTLAWADVIPVKLWDKPSTVKQMIAVPSNLKLFKQLGKNLTLAVSEQPSLLPIIQAKGVKGLRPLYSRLKNIRRAVFCLENDITVDYLLEFLNAQWPSGGDDFTLAFCKAAHEANIGHAEAVRRFGRLTATGISNDDAVTLLDDEPFYGPDGWETSAIFDIGSTRARSMALWQYNTGNAAFLRWLKEDTPIEALRASNSRLTEVTHSLHELRRLSTPPEGTEAMINTMKKELERIKEQQEVLREELKRLGVPTNLSNAMTSFLDDAASQVYHYHGRAGQNYASSYVVLGTELRSIQEGR